MYKTSPNENGQLTVSPAQAKLVREIFQSYLEVRSLSQVAFKLNARKIPAKKHQWNARAIRDALRNRIYIGNYHVAGVNDQVPELRIVQDEIFKKAEKIMLRYKDTDFAERPPMAPKKRTAKIETIQGSRTARL